MIRRLVAFDTTSAKSNLALIEFVRDYLAEHGVASELTFDGSGEKANLFATIGPADRGGVILSGHTDVVPVLGQPWSTDPWTLTEKDGRLYGRGTADMKSFLAIALALVPEWRARPLALPIHLALSYDEEVGCLGVPRLIERLPDGALRPRLVVIGEPTELRVVNAHKGCYLYRTTVTGLEAHSSAPQRGVSAVMAAARLIGFIGDLAEERRAAGADPRFEPPYTTFNVGVVEGGTAFNIIARQCRFIWEFRAVPNEDPAAIEAKLDRFVATELLPRMREIHPGANVVTERVVMLPAFAPERDSPAEALARRLTGANESGTVAFGTEAGHFQSAGIPTVVCGPGSIDQAHQPDEFISLDQVAAGERFLRRLAEWCERPETILAEAQGGGGAGTSSARKALGDVPISSRIR
jgi:acetylornithine deacetylase